MDEENGLNDLTPFSEKDSSVVLSQEEEWLILLGSIQETLNENFNEFDFIDLTGQISAGQWKPSVHERKSDSDSLYSYSESDEEEDTHTTHIDKSLVQQRRKLVVNIDQYVIYALGTETVGNFTSTGFIVNAEHGIIATAAYLAGTSSQQVKISFDNGDSAEAFCFHYDIYHNFAFYKIDPSKLDFPLEEAVLGSSFGLEEQSEVFMICNNDSEEFSIKFGRVTNLIISRGVRHSQHFQTTFDRVTDCIGSPVFDSRGNCVGIHTVGTDTTSMELRIEYLKDALEQLLRENRVIRGDIGVQLDYVKISDSRLHCNLPTDAVRKLSQDKPTIKYIPYVRCTVPCSPSENKLKPADLIVEVDGHVIGDNIYKFDKIVDSKTLMEVTIKLYRNGVPMEVTVTVADAEKKKIRTFALLAGGVFHDITPHLSMAYNMDNSGTFLSQVATGSCLTVLGQGTGTHPTKYLTVIKEICGKPTPNLQSFVKVVRDLSRKNRKHIYVLARNLRNYRSCMEPYTVTLDLKFDPLRIFHKADKDILRWVEIKDINSIST